MRRQHINLTGRLDGTWEKPSTTMWLRTDIRDLHFMLDRDLERHHGGQRHQRRRGIRLMSWLHRLQGMQHHRLRPVPVMMLAHATGNGQR